MKKYCLRVLLFVGIIITLISILMILRVSINRNMSWKIPAEKHVLFVGASHIERGIDDNLMKSGINYANSSERYLFTYLKLKYLLRDNPQIDTVFLQCAPTDLWENADDKYHTDNEAALYISLFCTLFDKDEYAVYGNSLKRLLKFTVKSLFKPQYYQPKEFFKQMGGYIGENENKGVLKPEKVVPNMIKGSYGHDINYEYLRKIDTLCNELGVKLYLVYCPVYHPEYFYNQEYYYNAYYKYFSDIELLDYSRWDIPLDEFYDAHHLNHKGAAHFTNELKQRFGIK